MTPAAQGFFGNVFIGGSRYTIAAAPQFRAPLNNQFAPNIGTGNPFLFAQGIVNPTVSLRIIPRDEAAGGGRGNPLSAAFWTAILGRTAAPLFDTATIGGAMPGSRPSPPVLGTDIANTSGAGIAFVDGARLILLYGVKIESVRLGTAKGSDLTFDVNFVGTGFYSYDIDKTNLGSDAIQALVQSMLATSGECAAQVRFASVTFEEAALADTVFGFTLSYNNNHTPNMALNGSYTPGQYNAGMPSGGLSLNLQALDVPPGHLSGLSSAGATLRIETATRLFRLSIPRLVIENPYDASAPLGRLMRQYGYTLAGSCSAPNTNTAPIIQLISSTF